MPIDDYVAYFKMKNVPFTNSIGTKYLYHSEAMKSINNKLQFCVQNNSFALFTGEPGTGKSTFLRMFADTLNPEDYLVLYVSMSNVTPRWLYSVPLELLGIKPHTYVNDARKQFHEQLRIQKNTYNKKVVMIIDEAHLLTQSYRKFDLLEEIRFLLNGDCYDSGSPLALILVGQNEIWQTVKLERCKAISQRIMYVCRTQKLKPDEVGSYIAAHIRWAGISDQLFSSDAVEVISNLSEGAPRLINKICMHALNYAALEGKNIVTGEIATTAANNEVVDLLLKEGAQGE